MIYNRINSNSKVTQLCVCSSALANQRAPANGQKCLCNVDKALKNNLSIEKGFYVWTDPTVHMSPTKTNVKTINTEYWLQWSRVDSVIQASFLGTDMDDNARQGQEPITTPIMPQGQAA